MIQGMLWNNDIGSLQRLDDLQTFMERNDRLRFIRRDQLICTNPDDQYIRQTTGVIDHPKMIIMEHIKRPGCIYYRFVFKHNRNFRFKPQTYANFSYLKSLKPKSVPRPIQKCHVNNIHSLLT